MAACGRTVIGGNLGKLARRLVVYATAVIWAVVATEPAFAPVAWAQTGKESSPIMPRTTPAETEDARAAITRGYQILDQAVAAKDTAAYDTALTNRVGSRRLRERGTSLGI